MSKQIICWFSAGATSAVATKMILRDYSENPDYTIRICYADTRSEHPDNRRFLNDCQEWYGQEIEVLHNGEYEDIWDVFNKTGWLVGPAGARCTVELKKRVRHQVTMPDDIQVFGFDDTERRRVDRFKANSPDVVLWTPLLDAMLDKNDCLALLDKAGIALPLTYAQGFPHANCIPCVKASSIGYWNKLIRVHYPERFERMAKMERQIGAAICKRQPRDKKTGELLRIPVYLDELDPNEGSLKDLPRIECSLLCYATELEIGT